MRFLLVRHQSGGCDYTIGCGTAVTEIEARDAEAALRALRLECARDDDYGLMGQRERRIEHAFLVPADTVYPVPILAWRAEIAAEEQDAARAKHEAAERAEYERLRAKFGGRSDA